MAPNAAVRVLNSADHAGSSIVAELKPRSKMELQQERAVASFPIQEMTFFLDGGEKASKHKQKIRSYVENDPVFRFTDKPHLDQVGRYNRALEKMKRIEEQRRNLNLSDADLVTFKTAVAESMPSVLHDVAFLPTIRGQCTPEQLKKWLPPTEARTIIGCYAQTELAHGSNVRGLETTATYLRDTDEFEIHSPTVTSTKFWPGSMGRTSTHAVVFAQLVIDGKVLGPHWFVVQIRCMETHKHLKGIEAGDIGPKFGSNGVDNGYLRFDHVRIPRENMLMRYAQVSRDGKYSAMTADKTAYGTMVHIRAFIVANASLALQKAVTIAARFSVIRRQFGRAKELEHKVLDYRMQQFRVLPQLAAAFALHFAGHKTTELYEILQAGLNKGDTSRLAEMHAISAGFKVLATQIASEGIETCRKACGGHGYLAYSGLTDHYTDYVQMVTVEGENYMLIQQTARFLMKASQTDPDALPETLKYYGRKSWNFDGSNSLAQLLLKFQHKAFFLIRHAATLMGKVVSEGKALDEAWNECQVDLYNASIAHCYALIVRYSIEAINTAPAALRPILSAVIKLFALYRIYSDTGDYHTDSNRAAEQATIRKELWASMDLVRADAIPLVDSFNLSDHYLNSALGRYDGKVYEALLELAKASPLNKTDPVVGYEEFIRPMLKQQYSKL